MNKLPYNLQERKNIEKCICAKRNYIESLSEYINVHNDTFMYSMKTDSIYSKYLSK